MTETAIQNSYRRAQAKKSSYPGHVDYGYTHGLGEKIRRTNIDTYEFLNVFRQKRATEWRPLCFLGHPIPIEISCYAIYHNNVCLIPNYAGYIPGGKFRNKLGEEYQKISSRARFVVFTFGPNIHHKSDSLKFGRTFGNDTLDAKRWLRGDHRPN